MSIRLFSDGHSFPEGEIATLGSEGVELCTHRTLLLPAELCRREEASDLLARSGLAPHWGELVVLSAPKDGLVAVMAFPEELLRKLPSEVCFTSPFLSAPTLSEGVWMMPCRDLLYIKVWTGGKLRMAEVFQASHEEEILYYALQLAQTFSLKGSALHLQGGCSHTLKRQLKSIFKPLLCE